MSAYGPGELAYLNPSPSVRQPWWESIEREFYDWYDEALDAAIEVVATKTWLLVGQIIGGRFPEHVAARDLVIHIACELGSETADLDRKLDRFDGYARRSRRRLALRLQRRPELAEEVRELVREAASLHA